MNRELISRIVAGVLVAAAVAAFFGSYDHQRLMQLQQMTPQEYYNHAKQLASEPFVFRVVAFSVLGLVYLVFVEVLAFVLRGGWRRPAAV